MMPAKQGERNRARNRVGARMSVHDFSYILPSDTVAYR